jgi:hypothetical protein
VQRDLGPGAILLELCRRHGAASQDGGASRSSDIPYCTLTCGVYCIPHWGQYVASALQAHWVPAYYHARPHIYARRVQTATGICGVLGMEPSSLKTIGDRQGTLVS